MWLLSHMTRSCLPRLTTLFLTVLLCFSQASSSLSYHNSMPAASITQVMLSLAWVYYHFPQHPTGMPSSPHSSSLGPVFKAQFSLASKIKPSGHSDYLKTPIPLVLNTIQVSISLFSNCFLCVLFLSL